MYKFILPLFLFSSLLFAEEWVEFKPPMMDDATVDPMRYGKIEKIIDLSDPGFVAMNHGQTSKATKSDKTTKTKLIVDYEFVGQEGLEYLLIKTPIKVEKPGFCLSGVFKTDQSENGPIRVRLRDPSGEYHQLTLGYPDGKMIYANLEKSPGDIWGGDGDKQLQYPCIVESILLDKPKKGYKAKGTLTVTNLGLLESAELRDVMKIEFPADTPKGFLFDGNGVLKFRLTPKNLKEGERLYLTGGSDLRGARAGTPTLEDASRFPHEIDRTIAYGNPPFVCFDRIKIDGENLFDEKFSEWIERLLIPPEGKVFEFQINGPGATRVILCSMIVHASELGGFGTVGLPVMFSFGSIQKDIPKDERLGVCVHYHQGWNLETLDFVRRAGIGMIRDEMCWGEMEKAKGTLEIKPKWNNYVDQAIKQGIDPLVILDYSNRNYDNNDFPHSDEGIAGFANYGKFVAEKFKGRVRYFEVWNEWTGGCGMNHARAGKMNTPENYVKMLKAVSETVRAANPEAYIIGGGGDHSGHQLRQVEEMLKLGAMKYCDAFSVHPYRQPKNPEETDLVQEVVHVAELMKQHGAKDPKIWITEIGWPTPKKHPAPDAEMFQATMVVRSAIPLLATGVVERYIWYDLKNDGLDRIDQEHNFGLIRNDRLGLQVKPGYVAFAFMASQTTGRKITKDEKLSSEKDGVYVYRLTKDGEPDRMVLWSAGGDKPFNVNFKASSSTNMFGTPIHFGTTTITLTDEPIWIVQ